MSKQQEAALDLLNRLKRANKKARETMAIRNGYKSFTDAKLQLESIITGSKKKTPPKASKELTDMVIAFDTTGSMSSYIDAVKKHVRELIPKLFKENPNLLISIVAFGDYCDMKGRGVFGDAYQVIDLTNDENKLINFVKNAKDTTGGDGDEFYELVIRKINTETSWRKGSNRNVLLIGDCSPHGVNYQYENYVESKIDWKSEADKASKLGIVYDTLSILGAKFYVELAKLTNGVCLPFSNSNKMSDVVYATSMARGGETTKSAFMSTMKSKSIVEDVEMSAVYSTYSKEIIK